MSSFLIKSLTIFLLSFTGINFAGEQPCRVAVRHIEGGGIGYNQGYTTFEGFFSPDPALMVMPFFDLRGHVFNNGKGAVNAGVGLRKIERGRVYGINSYYDYRKTHKRIHYNQVGFGFETLGSLCDFRINGYLPVGKKVTSSPYTFTRFSGHNMLLSKEYEFAMKGFNAELGFHFGQSLGKSRLFDFYAGAGPYYFTEKMRPNIWGGKARLGCRFNEYVTIELRNSYDKTFRNRFQCELTLSLPFGHGSTIEQTDDYDSCALQDLLFSRMLQPVERQEIIVVDHAKRCSAAIDPATGEPYNFVFVDNTSHSEGTYESPYPTLALAQANSEFGDIIYVFPGDGTTNGMNAGITLKDNQKFWGSGIDHAIQATQGTFIIPAQSSSAPIMTNIAGDGITLASTNQISGFTIADTLGNGINGFNAQNIDIAQCTIDSSLSDQIHIEYNGSSSSALTFNNLTLTDGGINGIFIDTAASSVACLVNNCTIKNNDVFAIDASYDQQAAVSLVSSTIEGINGISFNFSGPSTVSVTSNTFANSSSISEPPLVVTAGTSPLTAVVQNNTMSNNTCSSIRFNLNNTDSAQLTVAGNTITNNGTGSEGPFGAPLCINPNNTVSGNCSLTVINNTFSNNVGSCVYCANGSFNDFQVNASGNTLTNNGGAGFVFANACNTFGLTATNNTIASGGDNGFATAGVAITTATMTLSNNQITGNTNSASGINLNHEGTNLNLIVTNNNISNNDTSGIIMYSSNVIENVTMNIENNSMNNNQNLGSNAAGGIDIEQYANLSGTIANNTLSDNVSGDFYTASTAVVSPSICLTMSGNTSNMGYTIVNNGTGAYNLAPCDYAMVNTGSFNLGGTITPVQSCPGAAPCS